MFVTRPSNKVALMLNSMLGDTLGWKLKAENLLRKSGLDYVIVRPGGLKGGKDVDHIETQDIIEQFPQIGQGDNISGRV